MLLSLFFVRALSASSMVCPTYSCSNLPPTSGECLQYSETSGLQSYLVTPCIPGMICPNSAQASSSCSYPTPKSRYPGEYCTTGYDCRSNNCTHSICSGVIATQPCNTSADCNPGLYCAINSTKTCTAQLKAGSVCNTTDECQNNATCNINICTLVFTGTNQPTNTITSTGLALVCASGYAKNVSGVFTCQTLANTPKSNNT